MLKIYNSLTNQIEPFKSIHPNSVSLYVCGPTVYDNIHIGNARPVVFFDLLKSYLIYLGYQVTYASNVTDIDDKIVKKAKEEQVSEVEVANKYTKLFFEVTEQLNAAKPDLVPLATDYINQIIDYIKNLIKNKYAYLSKSGIYFRVAKIKEYGQLSKQNIEALKLGVRIELESDKESPIDFALWKFVDEGVSYESPWGAGRPGWHTECAVMTHELFGEKIDIHGGGSDLKFPHHENEIAQSVAHNHHQLANYWMHVGRINFANQKMSKSLGNTILAKDLISKYTGRAYRYYLLNYHYRQPIDFNEEQMVLIIKNYDKIISSLIKANFNLLRNGAKNYEIDQVVIEQFKDLMNDDLKTPNVITLLDDLAKTLNKNLNKFDGLFELATTYQTIVEILNILKLLPELSVVTSADLKVYDQWELAKKNQDYQQADQLRAILMTKGYI